MSEQTANLCTTDACESLRARLAKYEDAEGRPAVVGDQGELILSLTELADVRFDHDHRLLLRSAHALESQAREIELVRDALDHIARTCTQSRTQTRRLRWINYRANTALEGKPYDEKLIDLPKNGDQQAIKAELKIKALKAELAALKAQPSGVVLPEPKPYHGYLDLFAKGEAIGHNNCRREFVRLNSSPASLNQCDGCRAGIPLENGMHAMGISGGYADKMMCTASRYESAPTHGDGMCNADNPGARCKADQVAEPDAELVELLIDARKGLDNVGRQDLYINYEGVSEIKGRIDAKLASLK
jgi:hypothetical protein